MQSLIHTYGSLGTSSSTWTMLQVYVADFVRSNAPQGAFEPGSRTQEL